MHAWVDESIRLGAAGGPEGRYILAAALCDPERCDGARDTLRSLLHKKQRRLHWRTESNERRGRIAAAIGTLGTTSVVVVGMPVAAAKQERARRICFETLLPALEERGVETVWLEARTPTLNRADLWMVTAMRGKHALSDKIRVEVARPTEEPMLWIPDAVCGAVGAADSSDAAYYDVMRHCVTEIRIALR